MFTPRDIKFFQVAKSLAATSTHHKASIGAVIVAGRNVIAVGVNGKKSHPLQRKYNSYKFKFDRTDQSRHLLHAEIEALVRAKSQMTSLSGASIYVYRLMKNGTTGMARPCIGCLRALRDFKIRDVYYTTNEGLAYEELL